MILFQDLGADLRGEVRDIDPGEGVIGQQADRRAGRRRFKGAPQSQGRNRTPVTTRVHQDLVGSHDGRIHPRACKT